MTCTRVNTSQSGRRSPSFSLPFLWLPPSLFVDGFLALSSVNGLLTLLFLEIFFRGVYFYLPHFSRSPGWL